MLNDFNEIQFNNTNSCSLLYFSRSLNLYLYSVCVWWPHQSDFSLSHDPCHLRPRSAHPLINRHHGDRVLYKNYFLCRKAGLQSIQRIGVCVCVCVFNDPMLSLSQPDKPHPYSSSDVIYNAHKLTHTHSSSSITSLQRNKWEITRTNTPT